MTNDVAPYRLARYQAFHFLCPSCETLYYAQLNILYNLEGETTGYLWLDKDGKTYFLEDVKRLKTCCGIPLRSRRVRGVYNPQVPCTSKCFQSRHAQCECACGGLLHGVSLRHW